MRPRRLGMGEWEMNEELNCLCILNFCIMLIISPNAEQGPGGVISAVMIDLIRLVGANIGFYLRRPSSHYCTFDLHRVDGNGRNRQPAYKERR